MTERERPCCSSRTGASRTAFANQIRHGAVSFFPQPLLHAAAVRLTFVLAGLPLSLEARDSQLDADNTFQQALQIVWRSVAELPRCRARVLVPVGEAYNDFKQALPRTTTVTRIRSDRG